MGTSLIDDSLVSTIKQRRYADMVLPGQWTDQWGRKWSGTLAKETYHPTGSVRPLDWRAPHAYLVPASKYMTFKTGELGRVVIEIDQWIGDTVTAWKTWRTEMGAHALKEFAAMAQKAIDDQHPALMALTGPTPMHEDFLFAMKAGNRWVLGLPDVRTGKAYPTPAWATKIWDSLTIYETFEGSDVRLDRDLAKFADEDLDPDGQEIAARLEKDSRFADIEDDADPAVAPSLVPIPRPAQRRNGWTTDSLRNNKE